MKNRFLVLLLTSLFLVGALTQGCAEKPKLDLKTIADKILKTLNSADAVAVANLYAPDAVMIQADLSSPVHGREALLEYYKGMFKAIPDWKVDMSVVAFSSDTIVFEGVGGGTFTGPLATPEGEVAPTGTKVILKLVFLAKISPDGLIAEDRSYFDNFSFMKQLGLIK
jgi:uncharacterized protein (TIGR02246 family)